MAIKISAFVIYFYSCILYVKCNEVTQADLDRLSEAEERYEELEHECQSADTRVRELAVEAVQVHNTLRSMEINEEQAAVSADRAETRFHSLQRILEECESRSASSAREEAELEAGLSDCEEELRRERRAYEDTKAEYEQLLAELSEM